MACWHCARDRRMTGSLGFVSAPLRSSTGCPRRWSAWGAAFRGLVLTVVGSVLWAAAVVYGGASSILLSAVMFVGTDLRRDPSRSGELACVYDGRGRPAGCAGHVALAWPRRCLPSTSAGAGSRRRARAVGGYRFRRAASLRGWSRFSAGAGSCGPELPTGLVRFP